MANTDYTSLGFRLGQESVELWMQHGYSPSYASYAIYLRGTIVRKEKFHRTLQHCRHMPNHPFLVIENTEMFVLVFDMIVYDKSIVESVGLLVKGLG